MNPLQLQRSEFLPFQFLQFHGSRVLPWLFSEIWISPYNPWSFQKYLGHPSCNFLCKYECFGFNSRVFHYNPTCVAAAGDAEPVIQHVCHQLYLNSFFDFAYRDKLSFFTPNKYFLWILFSYKPGPHIALLKNSQPSAKKTWDRFHLREYSSQVVGSLWWAFLTWDW